MSCPECPHCQAKATAREGARLERLAAKEAVAAGREAKENEDRACVNCGAVGRHPRTLRRCGIPPRCNDCAVLWESVLRIESVLLSDQRGELAIQRRIAICAAADRFVVAHGFGAARVPPWSADRDQWQAWPDFDEPVGPALAK